MLFKDVENINSNIVTELQSTILRMMTDVQAKDI